MGIPIIGSLINGVINYFTLSKTAKNKIQLIKEQAKIDDVKRDQELKQSEHNAKVKRLAQNDSVEANYDLTALKQSSLTFIDEFMILWVFTIISLLFIPSLQHYAIDGFIAMQKYVPVWFQVVFVGSFISKLGLRFLFSKRTLFGKVV